MAILFAISGDPDQTSHAAASDLGLYCLSLTLLGISRLKWVKKLLRTEEEKKKKKKKKKNKK